MRGVVLAVVLAACDTDPAADAGANPCGALYPALRVETACAGDLRVSIDNRDVPPDPRRTAVAGAVIVPWPSWARDGMPSFVEIGGAHVDFTAHPYTCETVAAACP